MSIIAKVTVQKTAYGYYAMIETIKQNGKTHLADIEKTGITNKDEETAVLKALRMVYGEKIFHYWKTESGWSASDDKTDTPEEKKTAEKSRADDMKKSRANAAGLVQARLTKKAAAGLERLCNEWNISKTEVINKLLEESEQRQLL